MVPRLAKLLLLLFCVLILLPARAVLADTGPKPTMDFQFRQEMTGEPPVTIAAGILYECDQQDCGDASPLEEVGPQRFTCEVNSCRATAYGFAPYHRIEIEFSDGKTRHSNVFETAGFDSEYAVIIRPDDLLVEAQFSLSGFPRIGLIVLACLCAFVSVGLVVGLVIFFLRRPQKS
jgi:hypothetical protein